MNRAAVSRLKSAVASDAFVFSRRSSYRSRLEIVRQLMRRLIKLHVIRASKVTNSESTNRGKAEGIGALSRFEDQAIVFSIFGDILPAEHVAQKRPRRLSVVGVYQDVN